MTPVLTFLIIIKNKDTELYTKFGTEINTGEQIYDYLDKYLNPQIPSSMKTKWERFLYMIIMTFEQDLDTKLEEAKKILEEDPNNERNNILGNLYEKALSLKNSPTLCIEGLNILRYLKCKLMYISKEKF